MRVGRLLPTALAAALVAACTNTPPPPAPPQAPPGKSLVQVYRDLDWKGRDLSFAVERNGMVIGTLGEGSYFHDIVPPGRHYYRAYPAGELPADDDRGAFVEARPGSTHYVRLVPQETAAGYTARMFVSFEQQALDAMKHLSPAPDQRREQAFEPAPPRSGSR